MSKPKCLHWFNKLVEAAMKQIIGLLVKWFVQLIINSIDGWLEHGGTLPLIRYKEIL